MHPAKARFLLSEEKAAVFRQYPFTIILKEEIGVNPQALRVKIDPGSKTSGIAVTDDATGEIVFAMQLEHRGQQIKNDLESRRAIRRSRRNRKTRYRKPRFENRIRPEGWLAPSLKSRVHNIETWVNRLCRFSNIQEISMELVRFDMQKIQNSEISGVEYQQGALSGYEVREYLLEKWGRTCAYCGKTNLPLEIEHILPKSKGGSNRVSNLTLACTECNQKKGNRPIGIFLSKRPELLKRIQARAKAKSRKKKVNGFQTGDIAKAIVTSGKKVGTYIGRVAVRKSGFFNIKTRETTIQGINWTYCHMLHMSDGYSYNI